MNPRASSVGAPSFLPPPVERGEVGGPQGGRESVLRTVGGDPIHRCSTHALAPDAYTLRTHHAHTAAPEGEAAPLVICR